MEKHLDFYCFLGSTYTYLAVNRAEEVAGRENITLRWRPFSVRSIMAEQNNRPFIGKPVKLSYMWRDIERRAHRYGIPFKSIPNYPNDAEELANRVATLAALEGWCPQFAKAAYAAWFIENKDPGKVEYLSDVLRGMNRDPDKVIAGANSQEVRDKYAAETELARSMGAIRTDEVNATRTMIDRVEAEFNLKPTRLIGDMAYGAAKLLDWMINEKAIEPHVPVWDKTQRKDATLSSSDFEWDELADEYRCPQGHALRSQWRAFQNPRTHVTRADTIIYRSRQSDCATCPLKSHCCANTPFRKIARSVHESARDVARAIAKTNAYKQSRKDRKKVEMLFAHLKRIMKLDRLRLRGLSGAKDEFLMAAAVQNLRRMAKWLAPDTQNGNLLPA